MGKVITVWDEEWGKGFKVPIGSHKGKNIIIGADHCGFEHKKGIIAELEKKYPDARIRVLDIGTYSSERCDYPHFSSMIGGMVASDFNFSTVGIGICGSGIGILIPAGKTIRVYPARCLNPKEAETSRRHNNSNVLGIGADYVDFDTALETVWAWLETPFYENPEKERPYLDRFLQTVRLETPRHQASSIYGRSFRGRVQKIDEEKEFVYVRLEDCEGRTYEDVLGLKDLPPECRFLESPIMLHTHELKYRGKKWHSYEIEPRCDSS